MQITGNEFLYDIIRDNPDSKDFFITNGIKQVENKTILESLGKRLTINTIIKSKKINKEIFLNDLNKIINNDSIDVTLNEKQIKSNYEVKVTGVLPCPVRIPLLESFEKWLKDSNREEEIDYELKAASMGVDWLKENIKEESLSDVFLSAGFDLFFDDKYINKFKKQKVFKDLVNYKKLNRDFDNDYIDLKDPDGDYSILGVVPAVFLINEEVLGDKKAPNSWKELISGEYDNMVSLPVGDFDLFNAILLNVYKEYSLDGIRKLSNTLLKAMHPSQMVKSNTAQVQPAITIMPYFFTKMIKFGGPLKAIWPEDGAIISPIFMLTKSKKENQLKDLVEFFSSKQVGEIFSHKGLFPSTHPDVDNQIDSNKKYMWVGWSYIKENDIGNILEICMNEFNKERV